LYNNIIARISNFFQKMMMATSYQTDTLRTWLCILLANCRNIMNNKGRSPSNGKLSDFSFYIDS
jgi:hypothetical protein